MHLLPTEKTLKKWIPLVPTDGDLVFFKDLSHAQEFEFLGVPILTRQEAWEQGADLLGLNHRSWYGYVLGRTAACMKLPIGLIESLDTKTKLKLFRHQAKAKIPTVLEKTSDLTRLPLIRFENHLWITAHSWKKAPIATKVKVLKAYYHQNPRIEKYNSIAPSSEAVAKVLKEYRLEKLLNTFAEESGANCLALIARAISPLGDDIANIWLHWSPLKRFLQTRGFERVQNSEVRSKDILVFMKDDTAIHACVALDSRLVMEKPGQDFYEPYLITTLKRSHSAWVGSVMHIWRKT